jgi:hypothetical protein
MSRAITVSRPKRRGKRAQKINLRIKVEEAEALLKLVAGLDLTENEAGLVSNAHDYIEAKITIRERGTSSYEDDDEFN